MTHHREQVSVQVGFPKTYQKGPISWALPQAAWPAWAGHAVAGAGPCVWDRLGQPRDPAVPG